MRRGLFSFAILLGFVPHALSHVGSPNVFFEGRAGAYSVYAVIRPPAALPGAAQVSVRVQEPDIRAVSLVPVQYQAGPEGSPLPVLAQRVPGEPQLWTAEVWLLRPGSYTIHFAIDGARGTGESTVPVNVLGMQNQQMTRGLRATLLASGLFLVLSALLIVGAVAREGGLAWAEQPAKLGAVRWRKAVGITAVLLAASIAAGAVRWRNMDLAYRSQGVQKPEPVMAGVRTEGQQTLLELRQIEQSTSVPSWDSLVPDHGKLMHLFLVRQSDLNVFAHLHPVRRNGRTFVLEAPALPAGGYEIFGDVTFENGMNQTVIANVTLPEPAGTLLMPPPVTNFPGDVICGFSGGPAATPGQIARDLDDSWHVGQDEPFRLGHRSPKNYPSGGLISRLMGSNTLFFENASEIASGHGTSMRFAAFRPDGTEATLQPYMGMLGHAAVRRADGSVFAHLHPAGSFSMASQEVFRQRERGPQAGGTIVGMKDSTVSISSNRVAFPFEFPKSGLYRLWIQVRIAGRVLTGVYDLDIKSGT
jgi:hypothetical protein